MSPLSEDFRSPFATSVLLSVAISAVAFIVALSLVFIDINDAPVPEWIYQGANRETFMRLRNNLPPELEPAIALVHHYGENPKEGVHQGTTFNYGRFIRPGDYTGRKTVSPGDFNFKGYYNQGVHRPGFPTPNSPTVTMQNVNTPNFNTPNFNTPDVNTPSVNTPDVNTPDYPSGY